MGGEQACHYYGCIVIVFIRQCSIQLVSLIEGAFCKLRDRISVSDLVIDVPMSGAPH